MAGCITLAHFTARCLWTIAGDNGVALAGPTRFTDNSQYAAHEPNRSPESARMDLARNLKIDSVSRLHPTAPRQIAPEQPIRAAVELMQAEKVGCLLVVAEGKLVGIFTERDLLVRVLAAGMPLTTAVADGMTTDPVTVQMKDPISLAVRRMVQGGYRHLPVVDAASRPVGILSVKRIIHYLAEHFPTAVYNQPPDPSAVPRAAEGA
jgi:CBS domain-containing protein